MAKDKSILNLRQKRFCQRYAVDGNATQAYMDIYDYPNRDGARQLAYRLMRQEKVKDYIKTLLNLTTSSTVVESMEVIEFWSAVQRGEVSDDVIILNGTSGYTTLKKRPSLTNRMRASENLGKLYGLFEEKLNITSKQTTTIIDDIPAIPTEASKPALPTSNKALEAPTEDYEEDEYSDYDDEDGDEEAT